MIKKILKKLLKDDNDKPQVIDLNEYTKTDLRTQYPTLPKEEEVPKVIFKGGEPKPEPFTPGVGVPTSSYTSTERYQAVIKRLVEKQNFYEKAALNARVKKSISMGYAEKRPVYVVIDLDTKRMLKAFPTIDMARSFVSKNENLKLGIRQCLYDDSKSIDK